MRGRTLDRACVILDEAQNTNIAQLKMFLTRMGVNAKFIVTGDASQVDLPRKEDSGLLKGISLVKNSDIWSRLASIAVSLDFFNAPWLVSCRDRLTTK